MVKTTRMVEILGGYRVQQLRTAMNRNERDSRPGEEFFLAVRKACKPSRRFSLKGVRFYKSKNKSKNKFSRIS
mgnify:CR=1 FL=1